MFTQGLTLSGIGIGPAGAEDGAYVARGGDSVSGDDSAGSGAEVAGGADIDATADSANGADTSADETADGANAGDAKTPIADGEPYTDAEGNSYAVEDGVQVVHSKLGRGYPHITVSAGAPVRWIIDAPEDMINGCNGTVYIPEYVIEHTFEPGENIIEFTPEKPGEFMYSCWMGMITSTITVKA
jgi:hypothetical protein